MYKTIYSLCTASTFYNSLAVLPHKAIYPIMFLYKYIFFSFSPITAIILTTVLYSWYLVHKGNIVS